MAGKTIATQRDELVEEQLRAIRETLSDLKTSLAVVASNLDGVRNAELNGIRATAASELAKRDLESAKREAERDRELGGLASKLLLVQDEVKRSARNWSLISGAVTMAIVGAVMALVLHH